MGGKSERTFKDFSDKIKTPWGKDNFKKMTAKYKGSNDRIKKSEERQNKLALIAGITLKGNFEQRRSGWGNEENKPSCFECGSTEHFKALCPIWLAKRRKIAGIPAPSHNQNEKGKEKKGKERKRKERKGKERKGKERKGKERKGKRKREKTEKKKKKKGKERKGKERNGKERKGKERKGKEG